MPISTDWIEGLPARAAGWHRLSFEAETAIDVFCCRGGSLHPLALVTAGVHGDEYEGPAAVLDLAGRLNPDVLEGTVILVPVANPYAFAAGTRVSPQDGANLARTFPGSARGTLTERLAHFLFQSLAAHCDYLIDLHSGGVNCTFLPLAGFYGEPQANNRSFVAARHFGLPTLWQLPPTPGVLSYELWKRGIVSIGMEYLGSGMLATEGIRQYCDGALSCLALWGLLPKATALAPGGIICTGDWQLAATSGLFLARCNLGERVEPGQALAEVRGVPNGVERINALASGIVIATRSRGYIQPGDWAVLVARTEPAG